MSSFTSMDEWIQTLHVLKKGDPARAIVSEEYNDFVLKIHLNLSEDNFFNDYYGAVYEREGDVSHPPGILVRAKIYYWETPTQENYRQINNFLLPCPITINDSHWNTNSFPPYVYLYETINPILGMGPDPEFDIILVINLKEILNFNSNLYSNYNYRKINVAVFFELSRDYRDDYNENVLPGWDFPCFEALKSELLVIPEYKKLMGINLEEEDYPENMPWRFCGMSINNFTYSSNNKDWKWEKSNGIFEDSSSFEYALIVGNDDISSFFSLKNAVSAEQAVELINDGLSKVVIDALTEEDIDQIVLDTLGENAAIPNLPGDSTLFYNGEGEWTPLQVGQLIDFATEEDVSAAIEQIVWSRDE